jgi:solute carrier family 25, member 34/35
MQLQGELAAKGTTLEPYKGVVQAFVQIAKNDGWNGLQKGLAPSLYFQFIINSCRLGIYTTACQNGFTKNKYGYECIIRGAFWGATGGFIGAALASPFFMLKTHLQSQAVSQIAVGYQHKHTGMISALKDIFKQHGVKGLYRGVAVTLPRALLGSGGQLAAFGTTKDLLQRYQISPNNPTIVSFISGFVGGTVMAITMTPPDVIATRLYNQGVDAKGKGLLYKGVLDCFLKVVRSEGLAGLYKGFWPHYMRIGPHATLVLVFFDELKIMKRKYL